MKARPHRASRAAALAAAACTWACAPLSAAAQAAPPGADSSATWRTSATIYGYLPSLGGGSSVPADSDGSTIDVDADKILDSLKFTLMGSFDAHNGRWGFFTDAMYLALGGDKHASRDFTIGSAGLPAGTSADLGWDLKGLIWTAGGQYRLVSEPALTVDAVAGARWFDLRSTLRWNIDGDLGSIDAAGRSGSYEARMSVVDAIVGAKGRLALGAEQRWSVPFYVDVGAGGSDLTWQAAAGVSYAFQWGELSALWRYLSYDMKPGKVLTDLSFNGPMVGATFRW